MAALAWGKFFWRDWQSDTGLRLCSLAARGLWMDMLCIAAQHDPAGYVSVNGVPLDAGGLARVIGGDKGEVNLLLKELVNLGVCSRDEKTGAIFCRRMVSDAARSAKAQINGKLGGNPSLGKHSRKERSLNHLIKPEDKPPDKPRDKPEVNAEDKVGLKLRVQSPESEKESKCIVGSSDPTAPKRGLSEVEQDFNALFWKPYPRTPNMSRKEALVEWLKMMPADRDAAARSIPGYVAWIKTQRDYQTLHAVRFLKYRRFEGFLEPPDPAKVDRPAMKHGDVAPASAGRLAGYIWLKSETEDWDNWREYQRKNGLKTSPTDRFGGWLFPTRSPPT